MICLICSLLLTDLGNYSGFRQEGPFDLSVLAADEASRLQRQRLTFRIVINSAASTLDGPNAYECQSQDGVTRTVCFGPDQDIDEKPLVVEGRLNVVRHAPSFIDGVQFAGFVEYRLTDARRLR